jgi:hypothetical protein
VEVPDPNLPRIPIYVSILGLWSSMGQDEIYERWFRAPLEILGRFGNDRGTWRYQIRKKRGARRRVRSVERNMDGGVTSAEPC